MLARIGFLFAGGFWAIAAIVTGGDRIGKGIRTAPRDASFQFQHSLNTWPVRSALIACWTTSAPQPGR